MSPPALTVVAASPHLWLQVQEKDVVLIIHEHGSMQLKVNQP